MADIKEILWFDGKGVRPFGTDDEGRAFKWVLAEREGHLLLMAMPDDTSLDFHKELRDTVCAMKNWKTSELKMHGGGVRLKGGDILHRSTYFGEMPEAYRSSCLDALKLK